MSETISPSSKRTKKATCGKCQRTVVVVVIDGENVSLETELTAFVAYEGKPARIVGRRLHGEMCVRYQSEAERIKALAATRRKAGI